MGFAGVGVALGVAVFVGVEVRVGVGVMVGVGVLSRRNCGRNTRLGVPPWAAAGGGVPASRSATSGTAAASKIQAGQLQRCIVASMNENYVKSVGNGSAWRVAAGF
jgi:hypothetical protein